MLRIDCINWTVPKADLWYTGVTSVTLQQVWFLDQDSNFSLSHFYIFKSMKIDMIGYNSHTV